MSMLKIDEQLLNESKGLIGQPLEDAIFNLQTKKLHFDIFGAVLPKDLLLVNLEKARILSYPLLKNIGEKLIYFYMQHYKKHLLILKMQISGLSPTSLHPKEQKPFLIIC